MKNFALKSCRISRKLARGSSLVAEFYGRACVLWLFTSADKVEQKWSKMVRQQNRNEKKCETAKNAIRCSLDEKKAHASSHAKVLRWRRIVRKAGSFCVKIPRRINLHICLQFITASGTFLQNYEVLIISQWIKLEIMLLCLFFSSSGRAFKMRTHHASW